MLLLLRCLLMLLFCEFFFCLGFLFCNVIGRSTLSSFVIIFLTKIEPVALLKLCSCCCVVFCFLWRIFMVSCIGLWSVSLLFGDTVWWSLAYESDMVWSVVTVVILTGLLSVIVPLSGILHLFL